jgi:hypothetical protein
LSHGELRDDETTNEANNEKLNYQHADHLLSTKVSGAGIR